MHKAVLKKLVPPALWRLMSRWKGRYQSLHQGRDQPLLCNDFLAMLQEGKPHSAAFAAYYLGYCYRDLHGHFIPQKRLQRYASEEQVPVRAPLYLRLSNMAILPLREDPETTTAALHQCIGPKGRNMLRKAAKNGYRVRSIEYDEHLDDIFAVNTSKSERQGRPMEKAYQSYPERRSGPLKELGIEYYTFGCFDSAERLVAYAGFYRFGNVFRIDKVLGHDRHLTYGVMNLLFAQLAIALSATHPNSYVNYLSMNSIGEFKARVGFVPYLVLLPLPTENPAVRLLVRKVCRSRSWGGDWVGRYLSEAGVL